MFKLILAFIFICLSISTYANTLLHCESTIYNQSGITFKKLVLDIEKGTLESIEDFKGISYSQKTIKVHGLKCLNNKALPFVACEAQNARVMTSGHARILYNQNAVMDIKQNKNVRVHLTSRRETSHKEDQVFDLKLDNHFSKINAEFSFPLIDCSF